MSRILRFMQARGLQLIYRWSPREEAFGIQLVVISGDEHSEEFFRKTRAALGLIADAPPRHMIHVRRYLKRIVLIGAPSGCYFDATRAYNVDPQRLHVRSELEFASYIIHEATHGRIVRWGIGYGSSLRSRIERICVDQQITFLKQFEGSEELIAKIRGHLNVPWWTDEKLHERRLGELRALGIPEHLVRIYDRTRRP